MNTHRRPGDCPLPASLVGALTRGIAAGRLVSLYTEG